MRYNYGFVCIIAVLYPWYYTAVLYSSLKLNEYYTVRMSPLRSPNEFVSNGPLRSPNESVNNGPLRSPNESVSNGPLRSPNESDVESVEFRLQRIRGLLACYKVWDFRFVIIYSKWGSQKMLFGRSSELVTGRVMPGQCTASVPLATNRWL